MAFHGSKFRLLCRLLILMLLSASCCAKAAETAPQFKDFQSETSLVVPIPQTIETDQAKARLGKLLFEDKSISKGGKKACVECHLSDKGGTDNERLSMAISDQPRSTNTPTIFNVGLLPMLGWAGAGTNLEDVTEAIIKSKHGLASEWPELIEKLNAYPSYKTQFNAIYQMPIKPAQVKEVIAEYLRSLITPNSRFDQFLRGNDQAISLDERRGFELFKSYGCSSCHQGVNLGGNMRSPFGLFGNYMQDKGKETKADLGLFNKTKRPDDQYIFRVPGLRDIALTAPYFHDGSVATLKEAIDVMGRYMLGREIPEKETALIEKFLRSLTGELNGEPL